MPNAATTKRSRVRPVTYVDRLDSLRTVMRSPAVVMNLDQLRADLEVGERSYGRILGERVLKGAKHVRLTSAPRHRSFLVRFFKSR